MAAPPSRAQRAGALALLLASLALFASECAWNPRIPYIDLPDSPAWIGYPIAADGRVGVAPRDALPVTVFTRRFAVDRAADARLRVRALRAFEVAIDGEAIALPPAAHWRDWRDLSLPLAPGTHELRISATNATGPALVAAELRFADTRVVTDPSWQARHADERARAAIRIDTSRRNPNAFRMPTLGEGLAARAASLAAAAIVGALAFLTLRTRRAARALAAAIGLGLLALWLGPLAANALGLPHTVGFDALHHVAYVEYLREHRALPTAFDGWSMFHPPLYYATTALLLDATGGSPAAWKLVGLLAGIGSLLATALIAQRLLEGSARFAAVLLAGVLPMNAYIASYVTNEALCAALVSAVVALTVVQLTREALRPRDVIAWIAFASAAVLTKYTAWIAVATGGLFLALAWWRIERVSFGAFTRRAALFVGGLVLAAGWFHARAFATTGQLFPLNTDLPGATTVWWAQPGFATAAFFASFGEVFGHPFFAGTHSAWDALYATLWGDGQLAGQMHAAARHAAWDWELMAAAYALALPATLCLGVGAAEALRLALRDPQPQRRAAFAFLLCFAWLLGTSVLYMTLRQPDYGLAKAFYGLSGITPLAVFFGLGVARADRWIGALGGTPARTMGAAWLAAFAYAALGPYLG